MTRRVSLACALLLVASGAIAQTDSVAPTPRLPLGDTLLSLPSTHMAPAGIWEVRFSHRFNAALNHGSLADQVHSLFGLDSNADVVFGVSYAATPKLQLALMRSNTNDTLEGSAKYVLLQQGASLPLNLTLRGGADWRTERDLGDRTSFFAQAIASHQFGRRAEVFILPTFVTKAGRAVRGNTSGALFDHAFNVPVAFALMVAPATSVVAEVIPPNRDLPDSINSEFGWSLGVKRNIGGHWFEVMLTNNQSTLTDQMATSTYQGSALDAGDIHLGFNIERRFGKRKR